MFVWFSWPPSPPWELPRCCGIQKPVQTYTSVSQSGTPWASNSLHQDPISLVYSSSNLRLSLTLGSLTFFVFRSWSQDHNFVLWYSVLWFLAIHVYCAMKLRFRSILRRMLRGGHSYCHLFSLCGSESWCLFGTLMIICFLSFVVWRMWSVESTMVCADNYTILSLAHWQFQKLHLKSKMIPGCPCPADLVPNSGSQIMNAIGCLGAWGPLCPAAPRTLLLTFPTNLIGLVFPSC